VSRSPTTRSPWYDEGLPFTCTRCGRCCTGRPGYVWVSASEAKALAQRLGLSLDAFGVRYLRAVNGRYSLREDANGACLFLDVAGGECRVYESRPMQCRTYPFWPAVLRSPDTWREEAACCPGIGRDSHVPTSEIRRLMSFAEEASSP
jgi:Fe-S-cluster containining protein